MVRTVVLTVAGVLSWTPGQAIVIDRIFIESAGADMAVSTDPQFDPATLIAQDQQFDELIAAGISFGSLMRSERICGTPVPEGQTIYFSADQLAAFYVYYSLPSVSN